MDIVVIDIFDIYWSVIRITVDSTVVICVW